MTGGIACAPRKPCINPENPIRTRGLSISCEARPCRRKQQRWGLVLTSAFPHAEKAELRGCGFVADRVKGVGLSL